MNVHEERARMMKALRLTAALRSAGARADDLEIDSIPLANQVWVDAARLAGVRLPSTVTQEVVVSMMRAAEGDVPSDPFDVFVRSPAAGS